MCTCMRNFNLNYILLTMFLLIESIIRHRLQNTHILTINQNNNIVDRSRQQCNEQSAGVNYYSLCWRWMWYIYIHTCCRIQCNCAVCILLTSYRRSWEHHSCRQLTVAYMYDVCFLLYLITSGAAPPSVLSACLLGVTVTNGAEEDRGTYKTEHFKRHYTNIF